MKNSGEKMITTIVIMTFLGLIFVGFKYRELSDERNAYYEQLIHGNGCLSSYRVQEDNFINAIQEARNHLSDGSNTLLSNAERAMDSLNISTKKVECDIPNFQDSLKMYYESQP